MKKLTFFLLFQLTISAAFAQSHTANDAYAAKFVNYYNGAKPDSIYTLLSVAGRAKSSTSSISTAVLQLQGVLGTITKWEYYQGNKNADTYVGVLERSGPVLYFTFNKDGKLLGFYTDADTREQPGTITVKTADAVLKGTLSVPEVKQKIPVVLMIAGSGPTDRDGNTKSAGVNPNSYLQISEALKQKNIAVLRYDKRGVGQSTTTRPIAEVTFNDMVADAVALVKFLKTDARFSKIIIAGHSEGSLIAILVCKQEKVDGFISISGSGVPASEMLKTQLKDKLSVDNYNKSSLMIDSIKVGEAVKQKLTLWSMGLFAPSLQQYLHSWMQYDPQKEIAKLTVPTLIVQGTTDIQIGVEDAMLLKKGKPNAQLKLITGMSHILKEGPADKIQNMATYTKTDLPLHPELIPVLAKFIESVK
ncbi:alpha/beta hydrolase [Mucilaginibacter sp. UR6-11]|uniref:alpha/beta hydrolase n=1 Tax=Mucilaginibacter sp. UR6-11 TaxID=1435644 RepID=UPI001E5E46B2|nr:alpha/beta fold hydrolase [Mucilaginibacter sp. UR6-11]MCC8424634.1 alpha/beta hydrolase [Mucilaginibacter sp. UR6-11]